MIDQRFKKPLCATIMFYALLGTLNVAYAQEGDTEKDDGGMVLEEIVVTAQRRSESLQDIGASVNALSAEQLEKSALGTGEEIANLTSGVMLNDNFGTQPVFVIRGIGVNDFEAITSPSAAIYIDDVFRANSISASPILYDQERVEILKGPQGTLYGRNASSGAINFISKRPTYEFEGYAKAGHGEFGRTDVEGAVSGPLSNGLLYRLSGRYLGYGESLFANVSPDPVNFPVSGDDPYKPEDLGLRGQLLWNADSGTDVLFMAYYADKSGTTSNAKAIPTAQDPASSSVCLGRDGPADQRDGCRAGFTGNGANGGGFVVPLTDKFTVSANFETPTDAQFYGGQVRIEREMDWADLTSITAYDGYDYFRSWDEDATAVESLNIRNDFNYSLFSQELRLAGKNEYVDWIIGAYGSEDVFGDEGLLFNGDLLADGIRGSLNYVGAPGRVDPASDRFADRVALANSIITSGEQTSTTAAVFTDNQIKLTDALTLIAGYRFTYEKRDWDASGFVTFTDGGIEFANQNGIGVADGSASRTENRSTGRLGLNWTVSDDTLIYGSFSEGFKSGGFDGGVASDAVILFTGYEPESVRQVELGIKSDPLPNLRLNAAVFHSEYDDLQARLRQDTIGADGVTIIPVTTLGNLDKADILGAELEVSWAPIDGLIISGTHSVLDTEISQGGAAAATFDGNELPFAPNSSSTFSADYEWPLSANLLANIGVNAKVVGDHYLRPENFMIDLTSFAVINARASIASANDVWEIAVWGKNLGDEEYFTNAVGSFGADAFAISSPLQWGVGAKVKF